MTDRATIFQTCQVGLETTPGVAVAATKLLQSLAIEPAIKVDVQKFRPAGMKFSTIAALGKEWVLAKLSGALTYTEIVYVLSSILGYAAPAQQGVTTAYKWTHSVLSNNPDTVKTFTVEQGGSVRAHRFTHGLVTALELSFSRGGIEVSGEMLGKALEDDVQMSTNEVQTLTVGGGTPTSGSFRLTFDGQQTAVIAYNAAASAVQSALEALSNIAPGDVVCAGGPFPGTAITVEFRGQYRQTDVTLMTVTDTFDAGDVTVTETTKGAAPTGIDLVPVLPTQIDVFLVKTAQADLDAATPMDRVLSVSWGVSDRFGPLFPLRKLYGTSFAATVETEPKVEVKLKVEADAEGMGILETLRESDTCWLRVKATGDEVDTGYDYDLQIDTALKVLDVSDFTDEDGVFAIEWTLEAFHDATWGKALQVDVVNDLSAL